jgi:hypothetical protein
MPVDSFVPCRSIASYSKKTDRMKPISEIPEPGLDDTCPTGRPLTLQFYNFSGSIAFPFVLGKPATINQFRF